MDKMAFRDQNDFQILFGPLNLGHISTDELMKQNIECTRNEDSLSVVREIILTLSSLLLPSGVAASVAGVQIWGYKLKIPLIRYDVNSQEMVSRLASWWRQSLKRRPVLTNTAVYATFYTAAELSQQTFNKIYSSEKPPVDLAAAARIVTVGSCLYAPTLYYWYKFLDKKFVGTSVKVVVTKVASDQLIATPILLATFYTLLGVLERKEDIFEELRQKYWKTFVANQAFWIPGQTINFFFIPSNLRVVYVASASFIWINVLCFIKRQKSTEKDESEKHVL